jgi:hypothetical protein
MATGYVGPNGQWVTMTDQAATGAFVQRVAVPATATSAGSIGQVACDASFFYYCIAPNTWVRTVVNTW